MIRSVANKYGAKLDSDIPTLAILYDDLQTMIKPVASTGFRAEVAKGTADTAQMGVDAARAMSGDITAPIGLMRGIGNKFKGVNEGAAINAVKSILD